MNAFKIPLLIVCMLLTACGIQPIKLKLLDSVLTSVTFSNNPENSVKLIKLSFSSDLPVIKWKEAGLVSIISSVDNKSELLGHERFVYKNKSGFNVLFVSLDDVNLDDIADKYLFDVYIYDDLIVRKENAEGSSENPTVNLDLIKDDYEQLELKVVVTQMMQGKKYESNEIILTRKQILELKKIEPTYIDSYLTSY